MSIFDSIKHKVEGDIEQLARRVESGAEAALRSAADTATSTVKSAESSAVGELKSIVHSGTAQLEQTAALAEESVAGAVHSALGAATKAAVARGLKDAVGVIEEWGPEAINQLTLTLGPVTFQMADIPKHYKLLRAALDRPPTALAGVVDIIEAVSPDTVQLDFGFEFSLLFVEIDALKVAGSITVSTSAFLDKARLHIAKHGG